MADDNTFLAASFRDPCGFVYRSDNEILRQVNQSYQPDYDHLMNSGLYAEPVKKKLLIEHEEVDFSTRMTEDAYKIIRPVQLDFVSYPYEWSFSQLKDAALATLEVQKTAVKYGMSLKDSSGFNVQFHQGRAVFIDTLSFEKKDDQSPWCAYNQYCGLTASPNTSVIR